MVCSIWVVPSFTSPIFFIPSQVQSFLQQVQTDADSEEVTPASVPEALTEPCERAEEEVYLHEGRRGKNWWNRVWEDSSAQQKMWKKVRNSAEHSARARRKTGQRFRSSRRAAALGHPWLLTPDAPKDAEGGQHLAPCFCMVQMR